MNRRVAPLRSGLDASMEFLSILPDHTVMELISQVFAIRDSCVVTLSSNPLIATVTLLLADLTGPLLLERLAALFRYRRLHAERSLRESLRAISWWNILSALILLCDVGFVIWTCLELFEKWESAYTIYSLIVTFVLGFPLGRLVGKLQDKAHFVLTVIISSGIYFGGAYLLH